MIIPIITDEQKRIVSDALKSQSELLSAYNEWQIALANVEEKQNAFLKLANIKSETLVATLPSFSNPNAFDDLPLSN